MPITKLDLDGTAAWNSSDAVCMSFDGSTYEHEPNTHKIIGDYNHIPFPANTFQDLHGVCYLEGSDNNNDLEWHGKNDLTELRRVMKPGGRAYLGQCSDTGIGDLSEEGNESLWEYVTRIVKEIQQAGLTLVEFVSIGAVESFEIFDNERTEQKDLRFVTMPTPRVILTKETK